MLRRIDSPYLSTRSQNSVRNQDPDKESIPWKRKVVNLLPYHDIGKGKHEKLGTKYNPDSILMAAPSQETQQRCIAQFEKYGIKATIGG